MLSYLHSKFAIRTWRQSNKENKKSWSHNDAMWVKPLSPATGLLYDGLLILHVGTKRRHNNSTKDARKKKVKWKEYWYSLLCVNESDPYSAGLGIKKNNNKWCLNSQKCCMRAQASALPKEIDWTESRLLCTATTTTTIEKKGRRTNPNQPTNPCDLLKKSSPR